MNIDLHIHTTASDGSLGPAEVVEAAAEAGLGVISITDHDTTSGIPEAMAARLKHPVAVVPGVEISASHPRAEVHLLGYWVDHEDPAFQAFLRYPRSQRANRIVEMCKRLAACGVTVHPDEVFEEAGGMDGVGRPHLARVLVSKGYVRDIDEAFRAYLGEGAPGYVRRRKHTADQVLAMIHRSGGVSVIAHPGLYPDPEGIILSLVRAGVMGIEVLCHDHDDEAVKRFIEIADTHGLLKTGGSDYHGHMLGASFRLGDLRVPYSYYLELKTAWECRASRGPTRAR